MGNTGTLKFVHLSDLHVRSSWDSKNYDPELHRAARKLASLVAYIEREHPDAYIVITGDITDSGTPA